MNHIDLFSGIGGFAYAAREVWGEEYKNILFCDNNNFVKKVLQKNFGQDIIIFDDIRTLTKEALCQRYAQSARLGKSQRRTDGAINANPSIANSIITTTSKPVKNIPGKDDGNKERKLLRPMVGNVSVVEKQPQSSSPSTTNMAEEIKKGKGLGEDILPISTLFGKDSQKNFNFSAITVITQKDSTDNVHTKEVPNDDIRKVTTNPQSERCGEARQHSQRPAERLAIDLLTGGFPCQPFSQAGKQKGTDDDRYLWPEMLRVIREFKPAWIIAENVYGLFTLKSGLVFEQVCADLEGEGYDVQPVIIPACAVNAPHRRDRIWIVGNAKSERGTSAVGEISQGQNAHGNRGIGNAPHHTNERLQRGEPTDRSEGQKPIDQQLRGRNREWDKSWREVAASTCVRRMDDGLPVELDGFKLTKSKHREERLKALGNAIVPAVAIQIMQGIKYQQCKKS